MTVDSLPPVLHPIDHSARQSLFTAARTVNSFTDEPVSDDQLSELWELARWAPTASNTQPLRVTFVRTSEGKERLVPLMDIRNQEKAQAAPVVAILSADHRFYTRIPEVFPFYPQLQDGYLADPSSADEPAVTNSWLQTGFFILAVRALGLAAGPMTGFDPAELDAQFLPEGQRSFMVVTIGHPGQNPWRERLLRLPHEDVVRWA